MPYKFSFILVFVFLTLTFGATVSLAQADASTRSGRPRAEEDLPTGIKETLAKARLKNEEKEYNEMLERAAEAAKLGAELKRDFERNQRLTSDDLKKIDSLEKLVKRIRRDLGGKSGEDEEVDVTNLENAFTEIENAARELSEELKVSTRYSVSVKAIENSNALLVLMQFVRSNGRNL